MHFFRLIMKMLIDASFDDNPAYHITNVNTGKYSHMYEGEWDDYDMDEVKELGCKYITTAVWDKEEDYDEEKDENVCPTRDVKYIDSIQTVDGSDIEQSINLIIFWVKKLFHQSIFLVHLYMPKRRYHGYPFDMQLRMFFSEYHSPLSSIWSNLPKLYIYSLYVEDIF